MAFMAHFLGISLASSSEFHYMWNVACMSAQFYSIFLIGLAWPVVMGPNVIFTRRCMVEKKIKWTLIVLINTKIVIKSSSMQRQIPKQDSVPSSVFRRVPPPGLDWLVKEDCLWLEDTGQWYFRRRVLFDAGIKAPRGLLYRQVGGILYLIGPSRLRLLSAP